LCPSTSTLQSSRSMFCTRSSSQEVTGRPRGLNDPRRRCSRLVMQAKPVGGAEGVWNPSLLAGALVSGQRRLDRPT
jgi:hypothetical protein